MTVKVGDKIRIIKAECINGKEPYKIGEEFTVKEAWEGGVITTEEDYEMYVHEFEVVRNHGESLGAEDNVNHPSHYTQGGVEVIDIIAQITRGYTDGFVAYALGNTLKYIARAPYKHDSPTEDIKKAIRYLEFALNHIEEKDGGS